MAAESTNESVAQPPGTGENEIIVSRVFDAPRELVWLAMVDPRHVVQWWGPRGFTTTIAEMDVRPGGIWKHVMHGPDGTDYPNSSVFKEVVKPARIVYVHGGARKGGPGANFVATWTFESLDGGAKTRLTVRSVFASAEERDLIVREYGAIEGGKQTLARLSEHLPTMDGNVFEFILTRLFNAPRELVFKAWAEPKHLARWWGPPGFSTPVCEMDFRVGGAYRTVMRGADGVEYPVKGIYTELVRPERIVMTQDLSEHPQAWHDMIKPGEANPAGELLTSVTFENLDGKTKLTVRTRFATAAIRDAMLKMGMTEGWSMSLDRLKAELANMEK